MNASWLRLITMNYDYLNYKYQVPDRSAKTLMTEIKNHIRPGSVIYSDSWRGYNHDELLESEFSHFTVNHRYNFIDPETAANTQKIERLWGSAKWRNKRQRYSVSSFG